MAFNKKTWKARQGLGLNKFSIDGATPVPITNQPDSVTQQGDALSAGNLNNLEDRIAEAFDDMETEKADKSTTDDLQNQIINLNTDVDTLDAIVGCEAEVENVDPSEGQSILASSRLIHHVNLLPSGEFGLVGARDVKFNQLIVKGNFPSDTTTEWQTSSATKSISNNVCTVTPSGSNGQLYQNFSYLKGHVYLAVGEVKLSSAVSSVRMIVNGTNVVSTYASSNTSWQTLTAIMSESTGVNGSLIFRDNNGTTAFDVRNVNIFDLTDMDMASFTASQFRALFPASFYPFDAGSIVNLNPTGFSIRGINLWEETWEVGSINSTTGQNASSSSLIRSKGYISVSAGETYYFKGMTATVGSGVAIFCYDINKNYIAFIDDKQNSSFTVPTNCVYIRFIHIGTTYNNSIQICYDSLPSSVKTVYHPYSGQTVPVSISGHYVNENVYDYVTNKTVDGVLRGEVHTRVGSVDLSTLYFTYNSSWGCWIGTATNDMKLPTSNLNPIKAIHGEMTPVMASGFTTSSEVNTFAVNVTSTFYVNNGSTTTPPSGTLLYELTTEVVTYTEPLRSFSVSDYATIEPITPQTLPNRIDVPFSILSKSNNGLIEQIRTNTSDIADNKAIISQHEARIANLEQVSGEYVQTDLQDFSTVPTGKASYALVETMKGVSRVENQLMNKSFLRPTNSDNGITCTNNGDGTFTVSGTATGASYTYFYSDGITLNPSHTYFVVGNTYTRVTAIVNGSTTYFSPASSLISGASQLTQIFNNIPSGTTVNFKLPVVLVDLTVYFNGSIPSNAQTIAGIAQYYPQLLVPRDYTAGEMKDATYTKVESVGVNIWDEEWLNGEYNGSGVYVPSSAYLCSKNPTPVKPSTEYYFKMPYVVDVRLYDINMNYLRMKQPSSGVITMDADTYYINFSSRIGNQWTTYNHDAQICLNSYADKAIYHPHMTAQLAIPSVTLKGAGSVSEVYDLESGTITHPLRTDTFNGTEGWLEYSGAGTGYNGARVTLPADANGRTNIVNNRGFIPQASPSGSTIKGITTIGSTLSVTFSTTEYATWSDFVASLASNPLVVTYAIATPSADTTVTPILNNTLKTEGGGTVFTDADVDGQFTLGFLNL